MLVLVACFIETEVNLHCHLRCLATVITKAAGEELPFLSLLEMS